MDRLSKMAEWKQRLLTLEDYLALRNGQTRNAENQPKWNAFVWQANIRVSLSNER